jgi:hypothetical protein
MKSTAAVHANSQSEIKRNKKNNEIKGSYQGQRLALLQMRKPLYTTISLRKIESVEKYHLSP